MTVFACEVRDGITFWHSSQWDADRIIHGFIGKAPEFSNENPLQMEVRLKHCFGAEALVLMKQVHGNSLFLCAADPPIEPPVADAIIIPRAASRIAIGVKTADCVPILIKTPTHIAAIHAGWRGLSNGMIERTLSSLPALSDISVLIGPCAGGDRYLVGEEVIAALGYSGIYKPASGGKFYLSLSETAEHLIRNVVGPKGEVQRLNICTIADQKWHSYRREGEGGGRNLAFVVA